MRRILIIVAVGLLFYSSSSVTAIEAKPEASLFVSPKQIQVKAGEEVSVKIRVNKVKDLFGAPFYLTYDPRLLEAVKVSQGDFLKKDGKKTAILQKIKKEKGEIIIGLTRLGSVGGVDGGGELVAVTFKALRAGQAKISLDNVDFKDSRQASLPIRVEAGLIVVK